MIEFERIWFGGWRIQKYKIHSEICEGFATPLAFLGTDQGNHTLLMVDMIFILF
jgi:hypothetical protein